MASSAPLQPIFDSFSPPDHHQSTETQTKTLPNPSDQKPPITCHVLDTKSGIPAANIPVTLSLIQPYGPSSSQPLTGVTNADGRVTAWKADGYTLEELFEYAVGKLEESISKGSGTATRDDGKLMIIWALKFNVGEYFKGEGFWTEVEVKFKTEVEEGEGRRAHWHVPLLLSPWSYTTYRGS